MGVVFEAHDEALDRQVAIKIISPHLADDPAFRERFIREGVVVIAVVGGVAAPKMLDDGPRPGSGTGSPRSRRTGRRRVPSRTSRRA
jgi:hypothetical protein